ncbi:hypothetical protein D8B26_003974 [Coccidioides posadasii str. Silveira]|uniref:Malate dehydrogenase n=3 Tax=Coccidioides posadasii TaxID=199306 RepID=E9D9L2_COCPS|nr:hypothetical protein CPC735_071580 [Coccidioides posadasii C735 delta SOWgp]EER29476.1 hypothetical protein CPC735_071580 [Coccidioides posadasii C735 delta SOWgp]EFW17246.1 malate dehydrogenase [Coccidioides posadasii str. Silveira]KMM70147.1 malate dehydrogenase [Coccidioides posadasii RMSCC 3488]QVM09311.1 hypothetical protein D8B26_003974 [Coccidioides posadasii str. Silveira]|eukprot:XP_003071621.1 hypothetical protein CPC735_071580 [Coccidioides posadasii C735 delta SOWgp]
MYLSSLLPYSLLILGVACAPIDSGLSMSASAAGNVLNSIRRQGQASGCNIFKTVLPDTGNGSELPVPASKLELKYITLGVGTQNYTCENLETPSLVGAVATLYDASCLVTKHSLLLDMFARLAVRLPTKILNHMISKYLNIDLMGHHYFAGSVPMFDLRQVGQQDYAYVSVAAKVPAPRNIDVDWLKLDRVDGSGIETVYRVKTTSGKAPATCRNMPGRFEVKYLAQYWMYG